MSSSIVVDQLQTDLTRENIGVAAIYLNHKEMDTQSPSLLLASLWRQLVFAKSIPSMLHNLYAAHREKRTRPSLDDDYAVLRSAISEYSKVFILVDALDEYPERERNILLRRLAALGATVNLMLTSRPHVKIDDVIPDSDVEALEVRATDEDVRLYVDAQISLSPRLLKFASCRPGLREEIQTEIVRRSDGM
jgi:hypothetical protein